MRNLVKRRVSWVIVLLIVSLLLAACGRGGLLDTSADEAFQRALERSASAYASDPESDVPGVDFAGLPRYPDSVRFFYDEEQQENEWIYMTAYFANGSLKEVSSYYEYQMSKSGWELEGKSEELLLMWFTKEDIAQGIPLVQLMFRPYGENRVAVYVIVQGIRVK
ncbi:MAG: hypothetical protein H8D43_03140 [Chloroflexi bacterium]|nr:hypothetical protein [Chloroflexota bacterium]